MPRTVMLAEQASSAAFVNRHGTDGGMAWVFEALSYSYFGIVLLRRTHLYHSRCGISGQQGLLFSKYPRGSSTINTINICKTV